MKKETCPKCGGTSGYEYKDPAILLYHGRWDHSQWDCENIAIEHNNPPPKTVKCLDCGKRTKKESLKE